MRIYSFIGLIFAALFSSIVSGELLRVEVTGHLTQPASGLYMNYGYPLLKTGDIMTGYCVYNTSNPDRDATSAYHGVYELDEIVMQIGPYMFSERQNMIEYPSFDVRRAGETYQADCPQLIITYMNSKLADYGWFTLLELGHSGTRADDAFPTSFPSSISYFNIQNSFSVQGSYINVFGGKLDSIRVVPEPGTLMLLAAGAVLLSLMPTRTDVGMAPSRGIIVGYLQT
jgi:hypothetical protein